jgi:hypothetical protein
MPLHTHRTTQKQNKRTQTSIPLVGFEPTIPVFERAKTVHALDLAVTVIGRSGGTAPTFLTSTRDGGEWLGSCPGSFTHKERVPSTHWTGCKVGPRARLDVM